MGPHKATNITGGPHPIIFHGFRGFTSALGQLVEDAKLSLFEQLSACLGTLTYQDSWDIHGVFIDFRISWLWLERCTILVPLASGARVNCVAGDALCDGIHVRRGALQTPLQSQALLWGGLWWAQSWRFHGLSMAVFMAWENPPKPEVSSLNGRTLWPGRHRRVLCHHEMAISLSIYGQTNITWGFPTMGLPQNGW